MTILYHYCSNSSFVSIIRSHEIWASEFTLSNDAMEGKWLRRVVEETLETTDLTFFEQSTALNLYDGMLSNLGAAGICLSENGDLLSQWRAYSENGSGVCIGFQKTAFGDGSGLPSLQRVEYDEARQRSMIQPTIEEIVSVLKAVRSDDDRPMGFLGATHALKRETPGLATAVFKLFPFLYLFKNPAFREEQEWRASIHVVSPPDPRQEETGPGWHLNKMLYRPLKDRIVPYRALPLAQEHLISEVIVGPRNITPLQIVSAALSANGWPKVEVRRSTASYR